MDTTALSFYAIVCGLLSILAPNLGRPWMRFVSGAAVGILAAMILPTVKAFLGP